MAPRNLQSFILFLFEQDWMASAGLVDAPHNSAVAYRPHHDGQQVFVGTGDHKLRLYDTRQRRPAQEIDLKDAPVTALAAERDGEDGIASLHMHHPDREDGNDYLVNWHRKPMLGCRLTRPD